MPITFEILKKAMEAVIDNWHMQEELNQVYSKYKRGVEVYDFVLEDVIVKLLEEILWDKETSWISYWLYELNCGKDYHQEA